jgi:hypothetical protein
MSEQENVENVDNIDNVEEIQPIETPTKKKKRTIQIPCYIECLYIEIH